MERLAWVDNLRGLAVILVVISHIPGLPSHFRDMLYLFHVPLFFFISGFLFNYDKYKNFTDFIATRAKRLLIPYLALSAISLTLYLTIFNFFEKGGSPAETIYCILYATPEGLYAIHNQPLWFLTCLFVTEILFFAIKGFCTSRYTLFAAIAIAMTTGYFLNADHYPTKLPWNCEIALVTIGYFYFGHLLKQNTRLLNASSFLGALFFILLISLSSILNIKLEIHSKTYASWATLAIPFLLVYFLAIPFSKLKNSGLLSAFGKSSLIVFGLHNIVILFHRFILEKIFALKATNPIMPFAYTIATLASCLAIAYIFNRNTRIMKSGIEQLRKQRAPSR